MGTSNRCNDSGFYVGDGSPGWDGPYLLDKWPKVVWPGGWSAIDNEFRYMNDSLPTYRLNATGPIRVLDLRIVPEKAARKIDERLDGIVDFNSGHIQYSNIPHMLSVAISCDGSIP